MEQQPQRPMEVRDPALKPFSSYSEHARFAVENMPWDPFVLQQRFSTVLASAVDTPEKRRVVEAMLQLIEAADHEEQSEGSPNARPYDLLLGVAMNTMYRLGLWQFTPHVTELDLRKIEGLIHQSDLDPFNRLFILDMGYVFTDVFDWKPRSAIKDLKSEVLRLYSWVPDLVDIQLVTPKKYFESKRPSMYVGFRHALKVFRYWLNDPAISPRMGKLEAAFPGEQWNVLKMILYHTYSDLFYCSAAVIVRNKAHEYPFPHILTRLWLNGNMVIDFEHIRGKGYCAIVLVAD